MHMSFMAMNRMVEEQAAKDQAIRQILELNGRPLLSHGRDMSDDALAAKLRSLGFDADRQHLLNVFRRSISAEDMARAMLDSARPPVPHSEEDWVWIALTCLWERWLPEVLNTEMVDDRMQAGYAALEEGNCTKACRSWLEAWRAVLDMIEHKAMDSLRTFDDYFGGTQCLFNWVQDLETELQNAGLEEPQFFKERIALCETMIGRFSDGYVPIENFKAALAESHFELDEREVGDRLFRRWLDERPQWGGGWIAWSDCYWMFARQSNKDAEKAEQILKEGLATPGIEDRRFMLRRLAGLYDETGRPELAGAVRTEVERLSNPESTVSGPRPTAPQVELDVAPRRERFFAGQSPEWDKSPLPASLDPVCSSSRPARVGRNDPCPCGSGKKFKKCCGKRT